VENYELQSKNTRKLLKLIQNPKTGKDFYRQDIILHHYKGISLGISQHAGDETSEMCMAFIITLLHLDTH
jgi:hypothetical protein